MGHYTILNTQSLTQLLFAEAPANLCSVAAVNTFGQALWAKVDNQILWLLADGPF